MPEAKNNNNGKPAARIITMRNGAAGDAPKVRPAGNQSYQLATAFNGLCHYLAVYAYTIRVL